eukprot:gene463-584_t
MSVRNSTPTPSNQEAQVAFVAKAENALDISSVLSTIYKTDEGRKKDSPQIVTCKISPNAISFTIEEGKHFQGSVSFRSSFFQCYLCTPQDDQQRVMTTTDAYQEQHVYFYTFKLNLSLLIDCLNIFGTSSMTTVQFLYQGYGHPFLLILQDNGVATNCSIKTMDAEETLVFDLITPPSNKLFFESENLLEAFGELDYTSSNVNIYIAPEPPFFRLSTTGQLGSFRMDYCNQRKNPDDIFESYDLKHTINHNFQLSLIKPCIKALASAKKTRLSLTTNGLLSFQHIIATGPHHHYVEFYVVATSSNYPDDEEMQFG